MKTRSLRLNTSLKTSRLITISLFLFSLGGCSTNPNIVPQYGTPGVGNSSLPAGQDIAQANAFLNQGRTREAAAAYFSAAQNYPSPERERLMLQAAELAAVFEDATLTQEYLAPLQFGQLSIENQTRFRLVQAQLAFNDRNYRETLRILPQRVDNIPEGLGKKVLSTRMSAAQASSDRLAIVQELVLQEPNLKQDYERTLNHDRIWNHAKQIPAFQLEDAKNRISHPIVKNWLSLAQLSRVADNGPISKRQSFRGDLGRWIQSNPNHPGMLRALGLLNAAPTTTVTPYSTTPIQKKNTQTTTVKPYIATKPSNPKPRVVPKPVVRKQVQTVPKPVVKKQVQTPPKSKETPYTLIKKKLNLP